MAHSLMIVQGGGPTAVFNASLAAAIEEARGSGGFRKIYGARFGSAGLARGEFCELSRLSAADLQKLQATPGAALGSSRFMPSESDLRSQLELLDTLDVHSLLFMGGNGTMRGALTFAEFCARQGYAIEVVGVPKTIDNDLAMTDRSPGFASAARYVAHATQELSLDLRSLPQPVTVLETMGRSVGWLAAASLLVRGNVDAAPHVLLIPELAFDRESFLSNVEDAVSRDGWAVVVAAEGIRNRDGSLVYSSADPTQQDPLKRPLTGGVGRHLAELVARELKMRCRSETPGLLGRASVAHRSAQDVADAITVAVAGVQALLNRNGRNMVALNPIGSSVQTALVRLEQVACVERAIPNEWLGSGPIPVTQQFEQYLRPLVGALPKYAPELPTLSLTNTEVE
jgi:ATP-dependent phosphofructokinase / diphosphate-dependent phosphofructokinase